MKKILKKQMWLLLFVLILVVGCADDGSEDQSTIARITLDNVVGDIENNTLKVIKKEGSDIIEINYDEAVKENIGTDSEKVCLCQAVAFRVSQIAASAWEDGVLRTYQIEKIRTGWNTGGPYEFFTDQEFEGQMGDLEIPVEKLKIESINGEAATPGKDLTISDSWYEITFNNGEVLLIRGTQGENGIYTDTFLELRSRFKNGDADAKSAMQEQRVIVENNLETVPFNRMIIE